MCFATSAGVGGRAGEVLGGEVKGGVQAGPEMDD